MHLSFRQTYILHIPATLKYLHAAKSPWFSILTFSRSQNCRLPKLYVEKQEQIVEDAFKITIIYNRVVNPPK